MSFQQAVSGLNATSRDLEVISNNIANANTYGTKVSRAEFGDVYANALNGTGTNSIGIGVSVQAVTQQFTQGNIQTTNNPLDLAINGGGFFQVTGIGGVTTYTRNGQFHVDREGYIVNNTSQQLMGHPADAAGFIQPGISSPLQLRTGGINPQGTTEILMEFNLDSRQAATLPAGTPQVNFSDPATYNNATSMSVYDEKGQEIAVTYYFQKTATDTWNVYVSANGIPTQGTVAEPLPQTTITFPPNGGTPISPAGAITLDIPASTNLAGAETMAIPGITMFLSRATQYGAGFAVTDLTQDGYTAGQLTSISIEKDGSIMARYSNGESRAAGRVELASFRNPQGLQPNGDNSWLVTRASGEPITGVPGDGSLGVLQASALEESNVDLTGELVHMITAQRAYQANAQTIKTHDQILQTLVNLR